MLSALCWPLTNEEFITEYYDRAIWRSNRDQENYFENFLSLPELDDLLNLDQPDQDRTLTLKAGQRVNNHHLKNGDGDLLANALEDNSLVLNGIRKRSSSLKRLCDSLQKELTANIHVNMYISPPGQQSALDLHYDTHDVFILQIVGDKTWHLSDQCIKHPLKDAMDLSFVESIDKSSMPSFVLKQGESLYIPAGFPHFAVTNNAYSAHLTIGIVRARNSTVFQMLAHKASRGPYFRQPAFAARNQDFKSKAKEFKNELLQLIDTTDFECLLEEAYKKNAQNSLEQPELQLTKLLIANSIGPQTRISAPVKPQYILKGHICTLSYENTEIRFPVLVAPFLKTIFNIENTPITIDSVDSPLANSLRVDICKKLFLASLLQLS